MSCRVSAYEKLITIHVLLEGIGENKCRVVYNCAHFSRSWERRKKKKEKVLRSLKVQGCLKYQFKNLLIFLDSLCPTSPVSGYQGVSHSPHSKQHFLYWFQFCHWHRAFTDNLVADDSYCFAPVSIYYPSLTYHPPWKLSSLIQQSYRVEQDPALRKFLVICRLMNSVWPLLIPKIFLYMPMKIC